MDVNYIKIENRLLEYIVQLRMLNLALGYPEEISQQLDECKKLVESRQYNVAVMGEFKRGKSALINALLGSRILPESVVPATATVNRVTYGNSPESKAVVSFKDGTSKNIPIGSLADYVTKLTDKSGAMAEKIREVIVYSPAVICQNHVDIIDTPGLDDEPRMTQITIEMIQYVDAVIIPIHAKFPVDETERNFICQIIEDGRIQNLIFVVTFMDQIEEDDDDDEDDAYDYDTFIERIKTRLQEDVLNELTERGCENEVLSRAQTMLRDLDLVGISSKLALEAFITNNQKKLKRSRFEEFKSSLLRAITSSQLEHSVRTAVETIDEVVERFHNLDLDFRSQTDLRLSQSQRAIEIIDFYGNTDARKTLEKYFVQTHSTLDFLTAEFIGAKEYFLSIFIRNLSQIQQASRRTVSAALKSGVEETNTALTTRYERLKSQMFQAWQDQMSNMEYYEAALRDSLGLLDFAPEIEFSRTADTIMQQTHAQLHSGQPDRDWLAPVLKLWNLASRKNLIELVEKRLDALFADITGTLEAQHAAIRLLWMNQYGEYCAKLTSEIKTAAQKQSDSANQQQNIYKQNYDKFFGEADRLRTESRRLWEEFQSSKE
ncbi:MAG: dynamin family protein [Lachnospiraceae bacterium]|nr:dynamin family protein [Lachnospiraceae bacterium]